MPPVPPPEVSAVVVEAPRLPPLGGEAAFAAQQIGVETLKTTPRLDEALKRAPGVSLFRRTGSDAANPTIQGLSLRSVAPSGAGRALVTLDGAPQNDPFGGWVIWSALPPESLEGATIVRGAGAGPYGAGALTGVVALQERPASGGLQALDAALGERSSARFAAAGGAEGLFLSGAVQTTAGYTPVRGPAQGRADRPANLSAATISARLQRELGPVQAAFRLGAFEEDRGAGLAGAKSVASGASATLTLARAPAPERAGWRLQGWLRSSDLSNTSAAVAAGRQATTPANDQYSTPALGYGLNAAWQVRSGAWAVELGLDARRAEGEDRERFRFQGGDFTRGRVAGGVTQVGGAYVEAVRETGDLILTGGARLDAWASRGAVRRETDLSTGQLTLDQRPAGSSGTTPTGRLGLRWKVSPDLWVRAAAYAGFRPPTLNELHRPFRVGNDVTEANPSLRPETLYGAEAGVGGASWSAGGFYNRLEDPITNVTVGFGPATFPTAGFIPAGGTLRQRRNAGAIEAWGLEADAARDLSPELSLRAAISATRARVDGGADAPQLTGKRPAQTPVVTATAGATWRPLAQLSLEADLRYESERFEDDINTRRLAPGAQLDLRAGWRLAEGWEAYAQAENLFDSRLEVGETADGIESYAAPRTVRVGLAFRR